MDEQQIIDDILDELYGYDYFLQEGNADTIKAKKEERKEKSDEIMRQINNICEKLEEELESVFGNDVRGMRKKIKLQVLTTIKSEIDNGNKIIDSNGKISTGKLVDIMTQSREEILEITESEKEIRYDKNENISIMNEEKQDDIMQTITERLDRFGMNLSSNAKSVLEKAIKRMNEFSKTVQEKIDSGMTQDEAIEWYINQLSDEEKQEFMNQIEIAGRFELLNALENAKLQEDSKAEGNDSHKDEGESMLDMSKSQGRVPNAGKVAPQISPNKNTQNILDLKTLERIGEANACLKAKNYSFDSQGGYGEVNQCLKSGLGKFVLDEESISHQKMDISRASSYSRSQEVPIEENRSASSNR